MAYSGRYIPNNLAKYKGNPDKVYYRSLWELHTFRWCDMNPDVKYWASEEVVVPYLSPHDDKMHMYFVDLVIQFQTGAVLLVEIKPYDQTHEPIPGNKKKRTLLKEALTWEVNKAKWKAAIQYANQRGWHFQVWTEKTLSSNGIIKG